MNGGRDPTVTISEAKRTFATQKARASWALEKRCNHDGGEAVNLRCFGTHARPRRGLWEGAST